MSPTDARRTVAFVALAGALAAVVFARWDLRRAGTLRPVCRVAVPPFATASGRPGAALFADGFAAAFAAQLGGIRGVDAAGPAELAGGDRGPFTLRLAGRLHITRAGWEIEATWLDPAGRARRVLRLAGSHERVFELQERLALSTAELCGIRPSFAERQALDRGLTGSRPAFALYLRARGLLDEAARSGSAAPAAVDILRRATSFDPGFALAHAALAEALVAEGAAAEAGDPSWAADAVHEAELARELDDHLPAIHLALVRADRAAGRTDAADLELRRLLSLRPEISAARRALR